MHISLQRQSCQQYWVGRTDATEMVCKRFKDADWHRSQASKTQTFEKRRTSSQWDYSLDVFGAM